MNYIEELKKQLKGKTAEEAIDTLVEAGILDGHRARRVFVIGTFHARYAVSDASARSIQEDIGFEFGLDRKTVREYVLGRTPPPQPPPV